MSDQPHTVAPTDAHALGQHPLPVDSIANGDCITLMGSWPADSVDLIFADPPYNIGFDYDTYDDRRSDDEYVQWTNDWISACTRLLKPQGSFYILIGDEYAAEARMHLKKLEREKKLVFRNWIIWHYTFGQNCKLKFNRSHAHLFYCVGSEACYRRGEITKSAPFTFNRDAIAIPSARQTTYADRRANATGKLPDDTWYLRPQAMVGDIGRHYLSAEMDTWYQARLCGTFVERVGWHPCQLPEALLERIIKVSSNRGQIVFDPFAGSGTTLAVARRLGRHWLGCELSEDYTEKALERIRSTPISDDDGPSTMDLARQDKENPLPTRKRREAAAPKRSPARKTRQEPANDGSDQEASPLFGT